MDERKIRECSFIVKKKFETPSWNNVVQSTYIVMQKPYGASLGSYVFGGPGSFVGLHLRNRPNGVGGAGRSVAPPTEVFVFSVCVSVEGGDGGAEGAGES